MACLDWKVRTMLSSRFDRQKTDSETLVRLQTYPMVSSHVRYMDQILCLDLGMGQQAGYGAGQQPLEVGGELTALWRAVAIKVNLGNKKSAECSRLLTAFKMISLALQATSNLSLERVLSWDQKNGEVTMLISGNPSIIHPLLSRAPRCVGRAVPSFSLMPMAIQIPQIHHTFPVAKEVT